MNSTTTQSQLAKAVIASIDMYASARRIAAKLLGHVGISIDPDPKLKFKTVGRWVLHPRRNPANRRDRRALGRNVIDTQSTRSKA